MRRLPLYLFAYVALLGLLDERPLWAGEPALLPPAILSSAIQPPALVTQTQATCGHELYLVSTRHLADCCAIHTKAGREAFQPKVARWTDGGRWSPATLEELTQPADPRLTVLFVHGNRMTAEESVAQGVRSFQRLISEACDAPPVRFIVWSWPSEPLIIPVLRDTHIKLCRAETESHFVAQFLGRLPATTPVKVIGFSLGARVVSGSLHLLGGGMLGDQPLDITDRVRQTPVRAMLVAGAIDQDWLLPGGYHSAALSQVDRMFLTYNPRDIVLRYYPMLGIRPGVEAAGYEGLAGLSLLGPEVAKVDQRNITSLVQRHHFWTVYLDNPAVMALLRREALAR